MGEKVMASISTNAWRPIHARMLVGGEWVDDGQRIEIFNPARPDELVGSVPRGGPDHILAAISAARQAQRVWARKSFSQRAAVLSNALARIDSDLAPRAELYVRENGRTLAEARGELQNVSGQQKVTLGLTAQLESGREVPAMQGKSVIHYLPYGVVVSIVPWNAPVTLAFLQIIPALLGGNAVVLKPPETCPLTLIQTVQLIADALPPGVLNVVTGLPAEIGDLLTTHEDVAKIGFTGSIAAARHIMANAARTIKGVTLELGGNDPAIVMEDADLGQDAMRRMCRAVFQSTGQVCMAIKRFYVSERIADRFIKAFSNVVDEMVIGDGLEPSVTMGPLHARSGLERAQGFIADAEQRGATVRELGRIHNRSSFEGGGYFIRPTIVTGLPDDAPLMAEEQFCPVIPITAYKDVDEAVTRANQTHFGLCGSVWTQNVEKGIALARRLEVGTGFVNTHGVTSVNRQAPYGGVKQSGIGRKAALEGIEEYMQLQTVTSFTG